MIGGGETFVDMNRGKCSPHLGPLSTMSSEHIYGRQCGFCFIAQAPIPISFPSPLHSLVDPPLIRKTGLTFHPRTRTTYPSPAPSTPFPTTVCTASTTMRLSYFFAAPLLLASQAFGQAIIDRNFAIQGCVGLTAILDPTLGIAGTALTGLFTTESACAVSLFLPLCWLL